MAILKNPNLFNNSIQFLLFLIFLNVALVKRYRLAVLLFLVLPNLILVFNSCVDRQKTDNQLKDTISGEWELVIEKNDSTNQHSMKKAPPVFSLPQGMTISNDSIEFYLGCYKEEIDDHTGRRISSYIGNFTPYKIDKDSIIVKNLLTDDWEFQWKFLSRKNDTLKFALEDSSIVYYKKLNYSQDTLPDFDQIIYSSSGCYGSCPIEYISITKEGNVLFYGEGYVKSLGFYSGKLDIKTKNYIFDKFRRADPLKLQDKYTSGGSDNQTLTTTFVKNGKIVKTINDYGMKGPKELIWAYLPISNIYSTTKLNRLPSGYPFYPKLNYYTFKRGKLSLPLEMSESFYLWTELQNSKRTNENFVAKYQITFRRNYNYWGPDPNEDGQHRDELKSITTDGRFYKFEYKERQSITYDIGYNFIDRNFKKTDFRKNNENNE